MIIKNIRVGSDSDAMTCGPVGGSEYVEVMAVDDKGSSVFVLVSVYEEFEKVMISPVPLLDIVRHMMGPDADFDAEFEKVQQVATRTYDYECEHPSRNIRRSKYAGVINVARTVMAEYLLTYDAQDEDLQQLMESMTGKDIDALNLEYVRNVLPEDEDEEDEEE